MHERVREPLLDRGLAPGEVALARRRLAPDLLGDLDEPVGRVGPAGEDDVLDPLEQLRLDVLVDGELAGVDDPHVEAGADRVVEEDGVHRLAQRVVAAEGEAQVRDAAARAGPRAALLDPRQRVEEVAGVGLVLLDPGRDGEDVRVEDQILGREAGLPVSEVVGAAADRDAPLDVGRLALLVERHHDGARRRSRGSAARLLEERLLALLQADRVDDPLALDRLQPGLEHAQRELSTITGQPRDLGLGRDRRSGTCASPRSLSSRSASMFTSRTFAPPRTCSSATSTAPAKSPASTRRRKRAEPVTFVRSPISDEAGVGPELERLEPAPARRAAPRRGGTARRDARDRRGDRRRVLGRRAAAAAGDVEQARRGELARAGALVTSGVSS